MFSNAEDFFLLFPSPKHPPVSYDIWVSTTGLLATLSPQVKLADHSIQLYLHTHKIIILKNILRDGYDFMSTSITSYVYSNTVSKCQTKNLQATEQWGPLKILFNFAATS